jgi:hypothetical protein
MNLQNVRFLVGFAVMLAVPYAGCGDDSGSGTGAGGASTKGTGSGDGGGNGTGNGNGNGGDGNGGADPGAGGSGGGSTTGAGGDGSGGNGQGPCFQEPTSEACQACCQEKHPSGAKALKRAVLLSCGCNPNGQCVAECGADPACADPSADPGSTCAACLDDVDKSDACALVAAANCSQEHPECEDTVECVVACP